jgi:transposase
MSPGSPAWLFSGVDEHVWHHVSTKPREQGGRGPKELTGMVDLTPDQHGHVRARLLDLVPGRSGSVYTDWLKQRGEGFRAAVKVATLDPFQLIDWLQERDR